MVHVADEAGHTIAAHAIGDRAVDCLMDAYEATGNASRHRIEHGMVLSDTQIERIARAGTTVVMQPEFLVRFAHTYAKQLGPTRAASLKRIRSLLDAEVPVGFSSDRPIVPGNPWTGIIGASQRPGLFDPNENCTLEEAVDAYTSGAARANKDVLGSLEPGRPADFQVYDEDPMQAAREGRAPVPSSVFLGGRKLVGQF
jgi:predicted amidohydrolase YtcJ